MREYWWILPAVLVPVAYAFLLRALIRRGKKTTGQRIVFATTCALILLSPFLRPPLAFVAAALNVLTLMLLFREMFKPEKMSIPEDA
jgi:hypothetical protein